MLDTPIRRASVLTLRRSWPYPLGVASHRLPPDDDVVKVPDIRYARNGETSLAYQVVGDGPTDLLLVSGFLSNLQYAWEYPSLARFMSRLATFYRLILMDRRGSGLSDRFQEAPPFETMLQDLEVVLDEAGSAKATLFGLWDGCATSILFAATYPERVSSLVLFSASAVQTNKDDYSFAWDRTRWEEWLGSIRDGWGTRGWVVRNARWMSPGMLSDPDELERWIAYTRVSASPSSAEAVMRNSMETDIRHVLPIVQAPALVLHRVGDQVESVEGGRYVASKMPNAQFVELPGDDGIPWIGDQNALLAEVGRFAAGTGEPPSDERRLAAVLFTDIVDSTAKAAQLGDQAWRELLERHHAAVRAMLERYRGIEVDTSGDGFFATFDGPARAARCAQAIAEAIRPLGLEIRAGVHAGEVETIDGKAGGIAVVIGARLGAKAGPSEVLVSQTVKDLVAGSGLSFEDAGKHELKGVPDRWRLYRVVG